ncbi:MAG: hypothetical protein M0Z40_00030 [Actinomycetota bacterium]|nr:hypothetical protein [Actinomycetota bacterium]
MPTVAGPPGVSEDEDEEDEEEAEEGVAVTVAAGFDPVAVAARTTRTEEAAGGGVVPESAAGADNPPAVAKLATIPSTTEPFAGTLDIEATAACPSDVDETWVITCRPVSTGVPAMAEAVGEPTVAALDTSAWEPATRAGCPSGARMRRNALRSGTPSARGIAASTPLTAPVDSSACRRAARARRTRALALSSLIPSAPATSS